MADHQGHRERLKERFRAEGLEHFSDIQVLELLLFYCIPRKDTNPIAHNLLQHFGSLSHVLEASVDELCKIDGIGESAAVFLSLVMQTGRYYQTERAANVKTLTTLQSCAEYLCPRFIGSSTELVYLLCLDAQCKVLCCRLITEGEVSSAGLSVRKVVETALGIHAVSVVLAHNHPGGAALPSAEDIAATKRIQEALQAVDVILADHIIVADGDYLSMVQAGYLQYLQK